MMDRIPDTAQPDHAQVQDYLPARDRPRHPRAFEPLRKDDLASGLRNTRAARKLLAFVAVVTHPLRACFDVTIGLLVELGLATKPPMSTQGQCGLEHPRCPIGLGLEHMAHLLGPLLRLVTHTEKRIGQLLHVPADMVEIDDPSPLQTPPGPAWISTMCWRTWR